MIRFNLELVSVNDLRPNDWNPNVQDEKTFEKEIRSIQKHGFLDPVLVRETGVGKEIIDGEHRWRAARDLGFEKIPVNNLGSVDDGTAKQLTILMNELKGKPEQDKLALLLQDLSEYISIRELSEDLPFEEDQLSSLIFAPETFSIDGSPEIAEKEKDRATGDSERLAEDWETVKLRLPVDVAEQLRYQIKRMNDVLFPDDKDPSPVMAIEAICQLLAQTDDSQLI